MGFDIGLNYTKKELIYKGTYFGMVFNYGWKVKKITPIYRSISTKQNGEWIVDRNSSETFLILYLDFSQNTSH